MTVARLLLTLVALMLGTAAAAQERAAAPLRVMSFNIRYPSPDDGANRWPLRRDLAIRTIAEADPDVIGMQEMFREQGGDVIAALPRFSWVGTGRRGGRDDEHMGLFWRRDRLRLVRWGEFWLSDTPEVPASISWGNIFPRMVTWGEFERIGDGRRFVALNTHFPYRREDEAARTRAARLIRARIDGIANGLPVVLTGDFNAGPDSEAHAVLTETLADVWDADAPRQGPAGTFHGFTGEGDRRIDWILVRGLRAERVRSIDTRRGAVFPSDHRPVLATLRFAD